VVFAGTLLVASPSRANGAYSHIHISHLAVDALPEGPVRTLLEDPEMLLACEQGSMFPDSGYAVDDPFGEFAHWEPFHEPFLQYLRSLHGGDFSSREAKTQIAFLLGVVSHGLADQIYDTTLLARTFEADGPENADLPVDQYADYFLVIDQGVMLKTPKGGPYPQLVHVLNGEMGRTDLTEKDLDDAMYLMQLVLGAQGTLLAKGGYLPAWNAYSFLGTHIYNEKAVGSLPWLAGPVSELWQVVWARLHGTDDPDRDMILRTIPPDGAVNFPVDASESVAYSRIGVVFGYGVKASDTFPLVTLRDPSGVSVAVEYGSPYGGEDRSFLYLRPKDKLAYDTTYTLEIAPGVASLGGAVTTKARSFSFRTRCADDRLSDCPPLDPPLSAGPIPAALPGEETDTPAGADAESGAEGGCTMARREGRDTDTWMGWLALGMVWLARRRRSGILNARRVPAPTPAGSRQHKTPRTNPRRPIRRACTKR
jgi:hypothetical protein